MPEQLVYPGVYVEEVPGAIRDIADVSTSVAAFVGRAWRGPIDHPVCVVGSKDFERVFGGLWPQAPMSQALDQFFMNGGKVAWVVRVATREGPDRAEPARIDLGGGLVLAAADPGTWGRNLVAVLTPRPGDPQDPTRFDLELHDDPDRHEDAAGLGGSGARELHASLSLDPDGVRYCATVLAQHSMLARVLHAPAALPQADAAMRLTASADPASGHDGLPIGAAEVSDPANESAGTGLYALGEGAEFNLLCVPPFTPKASNGASTWRAAAALCRARRALLLIDGPADATVDGVIDFTRTLAPIDREWVVVYHPWLRVAERSPASAISVAAPSGAVAGFIARHDNERGVWKAPAGTAATLYGVLGLEMVERVGGPTDDELARLNAAGICALRRLPARGGAVVWGARTLAGADDMSSEWKYVSVRRTTAMIESAVLHGTTWAAFHQNDERLWSQLRLVVGAYLHSLFRQGALVGIKTSDACFVRCGADTHTSHDIAQGRVNLQVGVALVRPAEFVILQLQLRALPGQ